MSAAELPLPNAPECNTGQNVQISRILTLDVLRGVAVLGILWINISVFGLPSNSEVFEQNLWGKNVSDTIILAFSLIFIEGTMRALFSMLFGASALLLMQSPDNERSGTAIERFARRNLLLILIGLIHGYILLWPYDILYAYGIAGLFLIAFRSTSPQALLIAACAAFAVSAAVEFALSDESFTSPGFSWSENQAARFDDPSNLRDLDTGTIASSSANRTLETKSTIDAATLETAIRQQGYWANLSNLAPEAWYQQTHAFLSSGLFDVGGMMLIGMALFRLRILTGQRPRQFYIKLLAAGYATGFLVNGLAVAYLMDDSLLEKFGWMYVGVSYNFGRLAMVLGHLSAVILVMKSGFFDMLAGALACVGRMALTNYISQTVICIFMFYGFGFGLFGQLSRSELLVPLACIWLVQLGGSVWWLRRFRTGPLEWLLRSAVDGRPRPILRDPIAMQTVI